jgi:hypothetical protein
MATIQIKNWEKFQHYKDRRPTWVKLLIEIIDEFDQDGMPKKFHKLPDSAKLTFILLACLRANYNKHIPYPSEKWLKDRLGIQKLDLQPLVNAGFVVVDTELIQDDTETLAPETERETYTKRQRERQREFLEYWNSKPRLPKIKAFSKKRSDKLKTRMDEEFFSENWKLVIDKLEASDFCCGLNDRKWKADCTWILSNSDNYVKVMEGKYDNKAEIPKHDLLADNEFKEFMT